MSKKVLLIASLLLVGFGIWYKKMADTILVDIRSFDEKAIISLAEARTSQVIYQKWFTIEPGEQRLKRGSYHFRLNIDDKVYSGLIAVNDNTPIVLK